MKPALPRRLLIVILVAALVGAGLFTFRTIRHALYWRDPAHRYQAPEGWMTLGYLERSHELPPRSLGPLLGVAPPDGKRGSLEEIAAARGEPLAQFLTEVNAVLEEQHN